jgi:hypothetical protein
VTIPAKVVIGGKCDGEAGKDSCQASLGQGGELLEAGLGFSAPVGVF